MKESEEKAEYVYISGGIRIRINTPKPENGSKIEQAQAKVNYYSSKVEKWKAILRKHKYADEHKQIEYNKKNGLK